MEISALTLITFLIFTPSYLYNVFAVVNTVGNFCNRKWDQTKSSIYPILLIATVLLGITEGLGGVIGYLIVLRDGGWVPLLVTSLSLLLTSYISYFQRFSNDLWITRFLYNK